ncbi:hypothetical protein LX16_2990 [Stackebrandtia albiflava]|uniref:Uncharacterized protein n=1 Tax=Stackebrandtia albiflava TaxID=406432 RepID=A0A562V301_9ACTN|nr:hypothetical protein [Stackebrandtia albiflava]TWJ12235.1 hypothetical protein LX16_2990 [Stackebrandtia albiflava]
MTAGIHRFGPLTVAAVAAIWWGFAITVLQPASEPPNPPAPDMSVGNNVYWVRETRWAMIVLVVLAFVWAHRGNHRRTLTVALPAGIAWIAADILLDRADVAGMAATAITTVVALAVVAAGAFWSASVPAARPQQSGLLAAFCVAAVLMPAAAAIESPTDVEPALHWAGAIGGLLSLAVALGCAVAASSTPVKVPVVAGIAVTGVLLVAAARLASPDGQARPFVTVATIALLLVAGYLVAVHGPGRIGQAMVLLVCVPVVSLPLLMAGMLFTGVAASLTALAGNAPINAADSDVIVTALAVVVGLILGVVAVGLSRFGDNNRLT